MRSNEGSKARYVVSQRRPPPLPLRLLLAQERDERRVATDVVEIVIAHK